ncbi:Uncharacterised protein [Bordetella pertussis]|nr:Uncharacterised protein [Bordetella pertussis]
MNASARTASAGGRRPSLSRRRTLLYEPVSTSSPKVETGCSCASWTGLSW